ncbi:MAG TPA: hypothetical protein VMT03_14255 [Polyangia bacterium]|nr:hypothetical protein [Polyangia bacterium]
MLPAVVLASWWAQAQPAPAAAPLAAVASPAPAPLDNRIAVFASYARRLGNEGTAIGPPNGFSVGGSYERRILPLPHDLDLSAGLDFFYDQFWTGVSPNSIVMAAQSQVYEDERMISQTSFAATATAAWRWRRLRPYAQVGGGFTIAYFNTPEDQYTPGKLTAVQPLIRTTAGLDVAVTRNIAIAVRIAYTHLFTRPTLDATPIGGPPAAYSFLGDLFEAGAGVALGF